MCDSDTVNNVKKCTRKSILILKLLYCVPSDGTGRTVRSIDYSLFAYITKFVYI